MITAERNRVTGHYVVTALVKDNASGPWYMSRQYYGYPKRVAIALYREYCQGNNIEIVRD